MIMNCTIFSSRCLFCRRKAYSTKDGKEVIFNTINVMPWKPEVVHCFRNALHIVRDYKSCVYEINLHFYLIDSFWKS